jgi:hypothetical protein
MNILIKAIMYVHFSLSSNTSLLKLNVYIHMYSLDSLACSEYTNFHSETNI